MQENLPKAHDYRERGFGHDFIIQRNEDGGKVIGGSGWGPRTIEVGDIVVLTNPKGGVATYKLTKVNWYGDPRDMFSYTAEHDGGKTFRVDESGNIVRVGEEDGSGKKQ